MAASLFIFSVVLLLCNNLYADAVSIGSRNCRRANILQIKRTLRKRSDETISNATFTTVPNVNDDSVTLNTLNETLTTTSDEDDNHSLQGTDSKGALESIEALENKLAREYEEEMSSTISTETSTTENSAEDVSVTSDTPKTTTPRVKKVTVTLYSMSNKKLPTMLIIREEDLTTTDLTTEQDDTTVSTEPTTTTTKRPPTTKKPKASSTVKTTKVPIVRSRNVTLSKTPQTKKFFSRTTVATTESALDRDASAQDREIEEDEMRCNRVAPIRCTARDPCDHTLGEGLPCLHPDNSTGTCCPSRSGSYKAYCCSTLPYVAPKPCQYITKKNCTAEDSCDLPGLKCSTKKGFGTCCQAKQGNAYPYCCYDDIVWRPHPLCSPNPICLRSHPMCNVDSFSGHCSGRGACCEGAPGSEIPFCCINFTVTTLEPVTTTPSSLSVRQMQQALMKYAALSTTSSRTRPTMLSTTEGSTTESTTTETESTSTTTSYTRVPVPYWAETTERTLTTKETSSTTRNGSLVRRKIWK